jgi:hypothetical protein
MTGGSRPGAGRKPVELDVDLLEKLSAIGCTFEEIAAVSQCTIRTFERHAKKLPYADAIARGRAKQKISVRRQQMSLLAAGNVPMAIFLGKVLLGQREVNEVQVSGPDGKAMFSTEMIDAILALAKTKKSPK